MCLGVMKNNVTMQKILSGPLQYIILYLFFDFGLKYVPGLFLTGLVSKRH